MNDRAPASWLRLLTQPSVLRRAAKAALIVGTLQITINHGDALLRGDVDSVRLIKMVLTASVPFVVSAVSRAAARASPARS
ncbi:MAG: nitrate/nitrite transporter NrtS, partial [Acidobacteriota bacterium]